MNQSEQKPRPRLSDNRVAKLIRLGIRILDKVSPWLAALWLSQLWFSTRRFKQPNREHKWLQGVDTQLVPVSNGEQVGVYVWNQQGPTVMLIHGWNGRAMQMGAIAESLQQAGFRVLAFDAPGHGVSSSSSTTIFKIVEALRVLEHEYGPFYAAVGHSFGGMVLARALADGMPLQRAVSIGSPVQVEFLVESFCDALEVPDRTRVKFRQRLEQILGADICDRASTDRIAQHIDVPLLIIHDRQDMEVPYTKAETLAQTWPRNQLVITEGLGHRRILRDQDVVRQVVDFVKLDDAGVVAEVVTESS